ncbi:MAG TPA: hypothetical protein VKF37_21355 [Chloroflexota bacterium]|nr:hypothetical protein [Chloroflexota bacterium]
MTITRSLRPLAAAALAAVLVLPAAASASGRPGGPGQHDGEHHGGRHASSYSGQQRHTVDGVLQTLSGTTGPATLTVQAGSTTVTVTVPATTEFERRYNGRSSLDELTVGDRITAYGSFEHGTTTTFDARSIKDWSIQHAYTRVVGSVATVQNGVVTLRVARGRSEHSPYWHGEVVWVTLPSSTLVTSGSVTATVGAVQPGVRVLVLGLYDRASRSLRAGRVRILGGQRQNDDLGAHRQNDDLGGPRRHDDPLATATPAATAVDDFGAHRQNDDPLATATPPAAATAVDDRGGHRQNDDLPGHP